MQSDLMEIDGDSYYGVNQQPQTPQSDRWVPPWEPSSAFKRKWGEFEPCDYPHPPPRPLGISIPNPPWFDGSGPGYSPRSWGLIERRRRNIRFNIGNDRNRAIPKPPPNIEPPRKIRGMIATIYSSATHFISRAWSWLTSNQSETQNKNQEIIAVETDSTGSKRRAVMASDNIVPAKAAPNDVLPPTISGSKRLPGEFPESLLSIEPVKSQPPIKQIEPQLSLPPPKKVEQAKQPVVQLQSPPDSRPSSSSNGPEYNKGPKMGDIEEMWGKFRQLEIEQGFRNADGTLKERFITKPNKELMTRTPVESYTPRYREKTLRTRDAKVERLIDRSRKALAESPEQIAARQRLSMSYRNEEVTKQNKDQLLKEAKSKYNKRKSLNELEDKPFEYAEVEVYKNNAVADVNDDHELDNFSELDLDSITMQIFIRPLEAEWNEKVSKAMTTLDPAEPLVAGPEGNNLTRADFGTLLPQPNTRDSQIGWLNDEIINSWFSWICKRKMQQTGWKKPEGRKKAGSSPPYVAFNSAWLQTVKDKGVQGIARWSKRKHIQGESLLECEKIFFPVNSGVHWTLLVVSPQARTIEYLDSMSINAGKKYMRTARDWLAMELGDAYNPEEWNELGTNSESQDNSNDCGVFVCWNGLAIAKKKPIAGVRQQYMSEARRMMAAILLNGGFINEWEL